MTKLHDMFIETDLGKIHLRIAGAETGTKPALLCLHMVPQSGQDFEVFMELAGRDRIVVAPDYPGYGDSEPLTKNTDVSIQTYAKAIWQAVNKLDLSNVEILGYHTGSKVGIEMALQAPRQVLKLYCISLSSMTRDAFEKAIPDFKPLVSTGFKHWLDKLKAYYDPELPTEILMQKYETSLHVASRSHLGFIASHLYNADILNTLKCLETPVVLINPNDDLRAVTPQAATHIKQCIFIDRPDWLPGFLDMKPQCVLDTINEASLTLGETYDLAAASL